MSKNINNKAIIWAKASQKKREDINFLHTQIKTARQYCEEKGLYVLQEYSIFEKGRTFKRDKFNDMIEFIVEQKEPINLIIYSNDILDMDCMALAIIADLRDREKIIIHHTQDGTIYHKKKEQEKSLFDNILASFLSSHKSDRMYRCYSLDN